MNTIKQSVFISRPVDEVFAYCIDPQFFDRWIPNFLKLNKADKSMERGHTFVYDARVGKKIEKLIAKVVLYQENEKWAYWVLGENVSFCRTWVFEPLSKGTKVHFTEERKVDKPEGFSLRNLFDGNDADSSVDYLKNLKRDLEHKGTYLPE